MMDLLLPVVLSATLVSCAATPRPPDAVMSGRTQALVVRTDPPGAACSFLREGMVVASVEATPGTANVPRDFRRFLYEPPLEAIAPMEVVCRKEGYLEHRATFAVAWSRDVSFEERPARAVSPAEAAGTAIGSAAVAGAAVALPAASQGLAAAAAAAPAAVIPPLALGMLVMYAAASDAPPSAVYAYRALPEFFLTPSTFDSEAARDNFFATLRAKFEAARNAQRTRIDAECRFWPCEVSDPAPCGDPVCERLRERADTLLASRLDQIPLLRAQVRIAAPSE